MSEEYVTYEQAAGLLGVSINTVTRLVRAGELDSMGRRGGGVAGLRLDQVEALALERERRRAELAEERRARAAVDRRPKPPADEHEWLSVRQAAAMLGVTRQAVKQQVDRNTVPYVWHDGQRWLRRDHVELRQRARRAQATRSP